MNKLTEKRNSLYAQAQQLVQKAESEERAFTEEEKTSYQGLVAEIRSLDEQLHADQEIRSLALNKSKPDTADAAELETRAFEAFIRGTETREGSPVNMTYGANGAVIPDTIIHTLRDGMGGNLSHVICASCCIFSGHDPCLHHIPSYVLGDHEGKQAEVQVERKKHSQSDNISRRRSLWRFLPHCGIYCCRCCILLVDHTGEEKESVRRFYHVKEKRTGGTGLQDLRK